MWRGEFWTKKTQPLTIDRKNNKTDIANEFAKFFSQTYPCNSEIRNSELRNEFKSMKSHYDVCYSKSDYILSVELVGNMIDQLHFDKAAGIDGLAIEHIK